MTVDTMFWFSVTATAVAWVLWLFWAIVKGMDWNTSPSGDALHRRRAWRAALWTAASLAAWVTWANWTAVA